MSSASASEGKAGQIGHLEPHEIPKTPEEKARYLGVGAERAKELYEAVEAFTGLDYSDIRDAQKGLLNDSEAKKAAADVEAYIAAAPKWGGGETYRGIGVSKEVADEILKNWSEGGIIDPNGGGTASWTSDRSVARDFSVMYNDVAIVFKCRTQSRGTSVKHISGFGNESEVLVSKDARYRPAGSHEVVGGVHYIDVEEA